ncbi:sensor histidine kinase [Tsuneonella mangrovi]|uniref:sensor histidine kinase n=1 Tax=Tsuneonella mangrovi TaxID=1982042 RepID=UPI001F0A57E4|nr:CHASE3 domain-containing protein [Tsuneonella mangrovi]
MSEPSDGMAMARDALRRFVRQWGNLFVFAVIAAALIGAVMLIFQTVEAERHEREQVQRTNLVLLQLRNISRAALSAETGQRGYVITLDRRYLGPYLSAKDTYRPAIARLRELLGPGMTPRQSELVDQIQTLADAKFAEMNQTVKLVDTRDLLGARALILSDEGLESMGRLKLAIREMEDIEQQILSTATADTARAEGRVMPLLSGLLILLTVALVFGYLLVGRTAKAEAEAAQAAALAEARDRADLLARELNHRVKNLFAVILAIVRMGARSAPEAKPVTDGIADRIHALLTAHEVTQGLGATSAPQLRELVETTVKPYLASDREAHLDGAAIALDARQVTPLGLVLHELTTNAVKYGCWAVGGLLTVRWHLEDGEVRIAWIEQGMADDQRAAREAAASNEPERKGFGSLLITSAARQLGGSIERDFAPSGLEVTIAFPASN